MIKLAGHQNSVFINKERSSSLDLQYKVVGHVQKLQARHRHALITYSVVIITSL